MIAQCNHSSPDAVSILWFSSGIAGNSESARGADGGIIVSYWRDLESIAAWQRHAEHLAAQREGRARWYARYARVTRVERAQDFEGTRT